MKRTFILSAIIGLLLYGCSSNEEVYNNYHKEGEKSFRVTVEQPVFNETRAHLDEKLYVVFEDDDKMAVYENKTGKSEYTYSSTEAKFSGISSTEGETLDGIYALYPSSAASSYNSGTLPEKQEYRVNSFFNGSQIMYGKTDALENGFNLKNMCGYIRLHLYGENVFVKEITLSVTGQNEYVSGDFYIETNGDEPSLKMNEKNESHTFQSQSTMLVCYDEEGVALGDENSPTVFYIALPPQTYSQGFSVKITDVYGRDVTYTAFKDDGFTLERNHIKPMEPLGIDEDLNKVLKIEKGDDGKQYAIVPEGDENYRYLYKWGYLVNNINKTLGLKLNGNVTMPQKEIEEDSDEKTYKVTDRDITVNSNGVPSGSNWVPLGKHINGKSGDISNAFTGNIEGNDKTINGLRISKNGIDGAGFIGMFVDGSIKKLTINDAYIYGKGKNSTENNEATGGVVAFNRHNTIIEKVKVSNSYISGHNSVGGIVGHNYRRTGTSILLQYIIDCSTDKNTFVSGNSTIGGICGYNYGAAIIHCTNSASVTGNTTVGGIAGDTRTYNSNRTNGYLIASVSTAEATITATATDGNAGGIAGKSWRDQNHRPSESYVVACYSFSNVSATYAGSLIGSGHGTIHSGLVYSSFAMKNGLNSIVAHDQNHEEIFVSNHFESASEVTQDFVDEMNAAIDDYNNTVSDAEGDDVIDLIKCHYRWQYNNGEWPTLISSTSSGNTN